MSLWTEKYKPSDLSDLISNKKKVDELDKWLTDYKTGKDVKKVALISGPPGVGKTTICHLLLIKHKYKVLEFNSSDIRGQKNIKAIMQKLLGHQNIVEMFYGDNHRIGVIMDEIDTLCNGGDRGGMNEFINIIKSDIYNIKKVSSKNKNGLMNLNNPIMCTYNDFSDKKLKELKKYSIHVTFSKPNKFDMEKIVDKIIKGENLKIDLDAKIILCESASGDVRRLINLLYDVHILSKGGSITADLIFNQRKVFTSKDTDIQIFDATKALCNNKLSIESSIRHFESDSYLIPIMIFENYPMILKNSKDSTNKKLVLTKNIMESLSICDITYNYIFENHNWSLLYFCAVTGASIPNANLSARTKKPLETIKIDFASLLNKISLKYTNKKIMNSIREILSKNHSLSHSNILYLGEMFNFHMFDKDGDLSKLVELIKYYNISLDDIEIVLKTLKFNNFDDKIIKKKYTSKMKKQLLNEMKK